MKTKTTIIDFLTENARSTPTTAYAPAGPRSDAHISFHMPGHKGRSSYYDELGYGDFVQNIMRCDITEIPGADALFCPETTIKACMDNYAELYEVKHTELLVNGSSAGVMASIMGTVPIGGKLILARNSHFSAYSALRLGGIMPIYVHPEIDPSTGLVSEISPEAVECACRANPDAYAILVTSPNYYGVLSDISSISSIARRYNMTLIVDQAHGAHLKFFDYYAKSIRDSGSYVAFSKHSAEALGADIVINSTHKTLFSLTGSAILNFCTDRVCYPVEDTYDNAPAKIHDDSRLNSAKQTIQASVTSYLRMLQTTSPSYLLMGSLDLSEKIMRERGHEIISNWCADLTWFYTESAKVAGLSVIGAGFVGNNARGIPLFAGFNDRLGLDLTKINISMKSLGLSGYMLERELRARKIIAEMVHGDYVMLMTGAGNIRSDYEELLLALQDISSRYNLQQGKSQSVHYDEIDASYRAHFALECVDVPLENELLPLYRADGRVLYDPLIIYPPGSPLACPGEILNVEVITYIAHAIERGDKVTGVDEEGNVRVGLLY